MASGGGNGVSCVLWSEIFREENERRILRDAKFELKRKKEISLISFGELGVKFAKKLIFYKILF